MGLTNHTQHDELIDIRNVHIDSKLPQEERIRSFVRQVKNPYRFKVGDITVNISYANSSTTLNDCFADMLSLLR